jgi:hypothetical protein
MGQSGRSLSSEERWQVITWLLKHQVEERKNGLAWGTVRGCATNFGHSKRCINAVWKTYNTKQAANSGFGDPNNNSAGHVGRKRKWTQENTRDALAKVPPKRSISFSRTAFLAGIPKTSLYHAV